MSDPADRMPDFIVQPVDPISRDNMAKLDEALRHLPGKWVLLASGLRVTQPLAVDVLMRIEARLESINEKLSEIEGNTYRAAQR